MGGGGAWGNQGLLLGGEVRGVSLRKEFLGTVSTTSQCESDEGEQGEEPLFVLVSRFLVAINAHSSFFRAEPGVERRDAGFPPLSSLVTKNNVPSASDKMQETKRGDIGRCA